MKKILITRSKERSKDLNEFLIGKGFAVYNEPLFDEVYLDFVNDNLSKVKIIIVTSFYGAKAVLKANISKDSLIFAVGKFSCQDLIKAGYQNIKYPKEASAQNLFELILSEQNLNKNLQIYYFRGEQISFDFKKKLTDLNFIIHEIICYKTKPKDNFSLELIDFSNQQKFDQVLLYSKNSSLIFYELVKKNNMLEYFKDSKILCFSDELAEFFQKIAGHNFLKIQSFNNSRLLQKFYE